jgi:hypothetical protein
MATKQQVKADITPRIAAGIKTITANQGLQALQALSASDRDKLMEAWNSGSITKAGRAFQRLRKQKLRELAEARADEILADDSINFTEWDDVR